MLVLPGVTGEAAAEAADRARAALSEVQVGRRRLQSSAGVATFPNDAQEAAELLERADAALYAAKHAGRRQTRRYAANLAARPSRSDERSEVEALLRRGDEAMHMVFQPVLELATGRVCGYEALARIDGQPVRRPDQWFAQAHRCGLGAELEALALHAALAVPDRPAGTFLALNVSPTALLAPPVADILPADLSDVVIELTEHELFTAEETLEACLAELRSRGARVALDDAGAGYAGLQQLIRVAPDILKVDRSLVHGAHSDPSRYALLEALVSFAGTTGAAVCGEGVEDLADLRALADLDATYAQGYALARPAGAWAGLSSDVAATADVREGVRVATAAVSSGAGWARTLAELGDDLADVTSTEELATAGCRAARLLGAEDVSLMWVVDGSLELLSDNVDAPGERWDLTALPRHHAAAGRARARPGRPRRPRERSRGGRRARAPRLRSRADGPRARQPQPAGAGRGLPRPPAGVHQHGGRPRARRRAAVRPGAGQARRRPLARSAGHQVLRGAVAVRGHRGLVDRLELGGGRVEPPLQLAEHGAEQQVPPCRLGEGARVAQQRWLDQRDRRPGRDVLEQRAQRPAQGRVHGQARSDLRVQGAEQRAVLDVQRRADGLRLGAAAGDQAAQQLGVVVVDAEEAPVERLGGEPHRRAHAAGEGTADSPCPVEGHGGHCNEPRPTGYASL